MPVYRSLFYWKGYREAKESFFFFSPALRQIKTTRLTSLKLGLEPALLDDFFQCIAGRGNADRPV